MQCICTQADIKQLGTILGVWAHPDDETFTMGGIMAAAIQNGQKVVCITATRGEKGVRDEARWPAARLGQIRTEEFTTAMNILGVTELCWLDYPDGNCKQVTNREAVETIGKCIQKYQPDTIFTFGSEGLTGHPDHQSVSKWTRQAAGQYKSTAQIYCATQTPEQLKAMLEIDKRFDVFFNIENPPVCDPEKCGVCIELSDEAYELKLKALKAMPSQFEAIIKAFEQKLRPALGTESFIKAN
jgi:LmbE family N-acetylglucosaminyl deacetylase